jgi:hypothetical protein
MTEIQIYEQDGQPLVEVLIEGETVWLSLKQMSDLFDRDKSVISRHLKKIFDDGELDPSSTVAKYATVQTEGENEITLVALALLAAESSPAAKDLIMPLIVNLLS